MKLHTYEAARSSNDIGMYPSKSEINLLEMKRKGKAQLELRLWFSRRTDTVAGRFTLKPSVD